MLWWVSNRSSSDFDEFQVFWTPFGGHSAYAGDDLLGLLKSVPQDLLDVAFVLEKNSA